MPVSILARWIGGSRPQFGAARLRRLGLESVDFVQDASHLIFQTASAVLYIK
jgi:hypothetical protein